MPRLISPQGRAEDVSDENVAAALGVGYRPEVGIDVTTASDQRIVDDRRASRGPLDQVGAAALGFARGATFGASDVVADSLNLADRETQANLRSDYAVTSALSEIGGAIAPALLTGGAGAVGAAARLAPAGRAAMISERIAQGGGIARAAAAGAFEGAAQTAGHYLTDAALYDKDLSAEAFMAEAGKGALAGGVGAGAFAAAERGFVSAKSLVPKALATPQAARRAAEDVDAALTKALAVSDDQIARATEHLDAIAAANPELAAAAQAKVVERQIAPALDAPVAGDATAAEPGMFGEVSSGPSIAPIDRARSARLKKAAPARNEFSTGPEGAPAPADMPEYFGGPESVTLWRRGEPPPSAEDIRREVARWEESRRAAGALPQSSSVEPPAAAPERTAVGRKPRSQPDAKVIPIRPAAEAVDPGDDLLAALAGTAKRLDAGESIGALNVERRGALATPQTPPTPPAAAPRAIGESPALTADEIDALSRESHRAISDFRVSIGEDALPPWAPSTAEEIGQKRSGIEAALSGVTPEQQWREWSAMRREQGWKYGPVRDPVKKEHPSLVDDYSMLSPAERQKDEVYGEAIRAAAAKLGIRQSGQQMPAGFDWSVVVDGMPLYRERPAVRGGIPSYDEAKRIGSESVYVVRPSDLLDRGVTGAILPGARTQRMSSIAEGLDGGAKFAPLEVNLDADGNMFVADGNHRLQVAAERGNTPIAVRFRAVGDASGGDDLRQALSSALTPFQQALAEVSPEAAAVVQAVKAQEAASAAIRRRFTIRDKDGVHRVAIGELEGMTVGRIKQAFLDANEAERAAILETIGPQKARALVEIVEGRAKFDKWYKNKAHLYEDGSYNPAEAFPLTSVDLEMRPPSGTPDLPDVPFAVDDELAGHLDAIATNREAADLAAFERAHVALTDTLGPAASPAAAELKQGAQDALTTQERKATARLAQMADDEARRAADMISLPSAGSLPAPEKRGGLLGMVGDAAAATEALQAVGVNTGWLDVDRIPVIGPLLGVWGKYRAASRGLSKIGIRLPFSGEARVAAAGAKTRDRMAESVDKLLGGAAKRSGQARRVAPALTWRAQDALSDAIYDDGQKRQAKTITEALRARTEELQAAAANPAGVRSAVRSALSDVRDPDVVDAAIAVAQRKVDYLAKHAPQPPIPDLLGRSQWRPSPTEIERFARRVRAANDPASVLEDIGTGRVTAEAAETLREVYPRLYQEAQSRLIERAGSLNAALPHALVVRLAVLFDAPLVRSLRPEHMAAIQAIGAPQQQQAPAAGPAPSRGAPNVSTLYMTAEQRRQR